MADQSEMLALAIAAVHIEIRILVRQLERRGALSQAEYIAALKATFNSPGAEFERFDHEIFRQLILLLEGHFDPPKTEPPPPA